MFPLFAVAAVALANRERATTAVVAACATLQGTLFIASLEGIGWGWV